MVVIWYNEGVEKGKAPAVLQHPGARPIRSKPMDETSVPQGRLLYASYSPPHVYQDGTDDGQSLVTALFREPAENGEVSYAIREYSLKRGEMFYPSLKAVGTGARRL